MVGLKTVWIIFSALLLLGACVPKTKQTQCGSNEAFNASLRSCVPVVSGPSSFINIESYSPAYTSTRYYNDTNVLTFTIAVSNPYNQSYSVVWERVFNAVPVSMCSNSLTCSFAASYLGTTLGEIGTHILTAKIVDGNGTVVDSHGFEIKINELPKPVINTATLVPSAYAFDVYPTDADVEFSFTIKNNGAEFDASNGYKTVWSVLKNGSLIYTETDSFTNFSTTGTNTAYLGASPAPYFDPASFGVGSYIVRATIQNVDPGEIVAEQQWNVNVIQPDLANVTTISAPAPGVTITAHNTVAYDDYPTLSWIYGATSTQPNFCVTIDDRDGTYAGDSKSIQVKFYLDSLGGDICTKKTLDTPGTQTICLIDANNCDPDGTNVPFDESLLTFLNANSTSTQIHKVTARLFDEATTEEFQRSDVIPSNGSYPIEWIVNVKPINTAPVIGFGTTLPTGCTSSGSYAKTGCQVDQGTDFTVSFTATDDFYSAADADDPGEFQWDVKLMYNGAEITSPDVTKNTNCSKAFNTAVTLPALSTSGYGTTQWTCTLAVPHYLSTGPLDPSSGTFQVVATMQDQGSPVGGAGMLSQSISWTLSVTETNASALNIFPQAAIVTDSHVVRTATLPNPTTILDPANAAHYASELETITFRPNVQDDEVDNFNYRVSLCTDRTAACTTSTTLTSPAYNNLLRAVLTDPDANPLVIPGFPYTIPEDFLISRHSTPIDVTTSTNELVYFKIDVYDVPSVLVTPVQTDEEIFQVRVRNVNPAPTINSASASPAVGTYTVYSGYQFTIDPGTVSDTSGPSIEKNLTYQWYARIPTAIAPGSDWAAIDGATDRVIRYTPGAATGDIELKLCFGDGTAANPVASTGSCSDTWTLKPKPFLNTLAYSYIDPTDLVTPITAETISNEVAVWYDDQQVVPDTKVIYSAYVADVGGVDKEIWVNKTVINTSTNVISEFTPIKFAAIPSSSADTVTNLSITGTADSLYIAYLASATSSPSSHFPRVRRIDKSYTATSYKSGLTHSGTFGFSYTPYTLAENCGPSLTCTLSAPTNDGAFRTITFGGTGRLETGDTLTINNTVFTANSGTGDRDICDSSTCGTVNATVQNIVNKINSSTLPDLQGIRAEAGISSVNLYSQWDYDYLDFDGSMSLTSAPNIVALANGLGKIFIAGGNWYLPVINSSLSGILQNNITVLSNTADAHLQASMVSDSNILTEIGSVAAFDHDLNTDGEMVIAAISSNISTAGQLSLYRYADAGGLWTIFDSAASASATDAASRDLFNTFSFEYVKLATNKTSNPYYYVIAREKAIYGAEYHLGRYNYELDTAAAYTEELLMTAGVLNTTDSTTTYISDALIQYPVLVSDPDFAEARIFFHSNTSPRLARWKTDDTIACGTCSSLNGSLEYQPGAPIAISQLAENLTMGDDGDLAGENTNDVIFTLFSSDLAGDDVFRPQLGFINIEAEAIQSTAVDSSGFERWRPPFVLD